MASPEAVDAALEAGLRYVSDSMPGISRVRDGEQFMYIGPSGKPVKSSAVLERIRHLAIPPAYRDVWICLDPDGHLQATGIDARGRKQYRYHPRFREMREESKFQHMAEFGRALPAIRERVDHDLALRGLPKPKVLAVVVYLLEHSLIRIGNEEYARQNRSYGLTTMLTRHVKICGQNIEFTFLGKSKTKHRIEIHDRRLARVVARIQDLPGQELFHYLDEEGASRTVSSADVNAYLLDISGQHFTAKDFRTWWGSLLAFVELSQLETPRVSKATKRAISEAMTHVAKQLGNTPAICRKCYVHPRVVEAFGTGALSSFCLANSDAQQLADHAEELLKQFLTKPITGAADDDPPGIGTRKSAA
jgi:DNA topoisomerase-1